MALICTLRFSLCMLVLGAIYVLIGCVSPCWLKADGDDDDGGELLLGPWFWCHQAETSTVCGPYIGHDVTVWLVLFQTAVIVTSLLAIVVAVLPCRKVCREDAWERVKSEGLVAFWAGLVGVLAAILFYMKPVEAMWGPTVKLHLHWAVYVFTTGSIFLFVFGLILLILPAPRLSVVRPEKGSYNLNFNSLLYV